MWFSTTSFCWLCQKMLCSVVVSGFGLEVKHEHSVLYNVLYDYERFIDQTILYKYGVYVALHNIASGHHFGRYVRCYLLSFLWKYFPLLFNSIRFNLIFEKYTQRWKCQAVCFIGVESKTVWGCITKHKNISPFGKEGRFLSNNFNMSAHTHI